MIDLSGKTVAIFGRLRSVPRQVVVAALERRGARVRRDLGRRTDVLALGAAAVADLRGGRLRERIDDADRLGVTLISERTLLRALGLMPPGGTDLATMSLDELASRAGLDEETLRLLVLFDLIETPDGVSCGFRDLVAAREIARLLGEGVPLADIIEGAGRLQRRQTDPAAHLLARHKLTSDEGGRLVMQLGSLIAELDGQLRLELPESGNPSVDSVFEAAEEAEQLGDLTTAEMLYRRCLGLDRRDPIAPFNLANVLREQRRQGEAKCFLHLALSIDPEFAEAWYNLAMLVDEEGHAEQARQYLLRAFTSDPFFSDPIYNLAHWYFRSEDYAAAADWWQRYLDVDPDSEWSQRARYGLELCRRHLGQRDA